MSFFGIYTQTTIFKTAYPNTYSDFKIRKRMFTHFYQMFICGF